MRLSGELLTAYAPLDYVFCVSERSWPVEPCSEGFGDECSAAGMMSTGSCVDVSKDGLAVLQCDAPVEDLM